MMPMFARPSGAAIALAACSELNDDLTVAVNVLMRLLDQDEVDRLEVVEASAATQRAIWTVGKLMGWANQNGAKASAVTLDRMLS